MFLSDVQYVNLLVDILCRSVFLYPPFGTIRKLGHTSLFNSGMLCQQLSAIARHLTIRVIPPSMPKYLYAYTISAC